MDPSTGQGNCGIASFSRDSRLTFETLSQFLRVGKVGSSHPDQNRRIEVAILDLPEQ
jgi:hypothetical protein